MDASVAVQTIAELGELLDTVAEHTSRVPHVNVVVHVNLKLPQPEDPQWAGTRTTAGSGLSGMPEEETHGGAEVQTGKWFDGMTGEPVNELDNVNSEEVEIESDPRPQLTTYDSRLQGTVIGAADGGS